MKLAIMGIRGIPANYGGFETFAESIAQRLVARGHEVTVYGRSNSMGLDDGYWRGVRLVILPTIAHKYLDTVAHTFLCTVHALRQGYDAILVCNSANAYTSFVPRLAGIPVALNVDGLEWQRQKWNWLGKSFYRLSEWLATFLPNEIVTDAEVIRGYYRERFGYATTMIPYGAPDGPVPGTETIEALGLKPRGYVLFVSRLEIENNAHRVVAAFERVRTDMRLVVVGDAPYNKAYVDALRSTGDARILFTGYVFGEGYRELQSHAYCYIQATEVGGTHPALLDAMGFGNCILANDVPEHREVLDDAGMYFSLAPSDNLSDRIQSLIDHPDRVVAYRRRARERAATHYSWARVTDQYERLFARLSGSSWEAP